MAFGYPNLYANGLNSNTQIRRSVDMAYQRGATYGIYLTGTTYEQSLEMVVDIYVNGVKEGRMEVVPYSVENLPYPNETEYAYRFNVRPYEFIQNFLEAEMYGKYKGMNWALTNEEININDIYPNSVEFNLKYGYRYVSGTTVVTEWTPAQDAPQNDFDHFTDIPSCPGSTGYTPSEFTNTGENFTLVGGNFQMNEKYFYPNEDQEVGSVIGTGYTISTLDTERRLSPMSQFLLDYPSLPEKSETSRFLTESPRIQTIGVNDHHSLSYMWGQTGDRQVIEADFAVFKFFANNDFEVNRYDLDLYNEYPTGYTTNLEMRKIPVGTRDINTIMIEDIFSNTTNITYYTVQLYAGYSELSGKKELYGPITPVSEKMYFYTSGSANSIRRSCYPESTRLSFLNSRGGFDSFTFKTYRQDTKKIARETFESRYYAPNYQAPDHKWGRSTKQFAADVDREVILDTDFLTVEEGDWLQDLFLSPQVYEVKPSFISPIGCQDDYYMDLTPVQVISTEVETITKKHKKLNKYRITVKYANSYFTNKGF